MGDFPSGWKGDSLLGVGLAMGLASVRTGLLVITACATILGGMSASSVDLAVLGCSCDESRVGLL